MDRSTIGALALLALAGCDYSGDFLFPGVVEGLEDVRVLTDEDGGLIVPADIVSQDDIRANTIYAEVGPPATTAYGGVTFDFIGTGGDICIWVDPELASWNPAVSPRPSDVARKWSYPDNIFDDGDLDLFAGLSVYYTGSPGEEVGDFVVAYEDSLGNDIPISLAACPNQVGQAGDLVTAGRGSPEFCTIPTTDAGISYTVLLRTWATPLDDDRLAFGVVIANGGCDALRTAAGSGTIEQDECLIMGEALFPEPGEFGPYYGFDSIANRIWPGSMEFEGTFCDPEARFSRFCTQELDAIEEAGGRCEREVIDNPDNKCFCGDINSMPDAGAF